MSYGETQPEEKDNIMPNVENDTVAVAKTKIDAHATDTPTYTTSYAPIPNGKQAGTVKSTTPSATNPIPASVNLVVYGAGSDPIR